MHVAHRAGFRAHIISMTITRLIKRLALYTTHKCASLMSTPASMTRTHQGHTHVPEGRATETDDTIRSEGMT